MFKADNQKFNPEKFFLKSGLNQEVNKGKTISESIYGLNISVPETPNLRVSLENLRNSPLTQHVATNY